MLAKIKQDTELERAFQKYEALADQRRVLEKQIEALKKEQAPYRKLIEGCVKCNNNELVCGKYKAQIIPVEEAVRKAYSYLCITGV